MTFIWKRMWKRHVTQIDLYLDCFWWVHQALTQFPGVSWNKSFKFRPLENYALQRESVFGSFQVRIFPHLDWIRECGKIRTKKTPNMDTFHAVAISGFPREESTIFTFNQPFYTRLWKNKIKSHHKYLENYSRHVR